MKLFTKRASRPRLRMRPAIAIPAVALALVAPASVGAVTDAAGATNPTVSGEPTCDTATGKYDILWNVTGDPHYSGETATIKSQSIPTTPSLVGQTARGSGSIANKGLQKGIMPGSSVTMVIKVQWTNHRPGDLVEARRTVTVGKDCTKTPPTSTCEKASPTYVWGPNVVSVTGGKPGTWVSLWDAQDLAHQTLISKVQVGTDCTVTQAVPPATCTSHRYQGDHSSTEPPATITDTNGDGVADIPGYIAGRPFTVPADTSSQSCWPRDAAASVTVHPGTCDAPGSAEVTDVQHATLVGTLDQSVGTHEASFQSESGHLFPSGSDTSQVPYTIPGKDTSEACGPFPGTVKPHPRAKVRAYCVTRHWGEGVAKLMNKRSTQAVRYHIVRSGKDRFVTVRGGKSVRVELRHLRVGSVVKIKVGKQVLDRAKVRGGCGTPPDSHTGLRPGTERAAAG